MKKFLRSFQDQAAYGAAKQSEDFYRPCVSLVGDSSLQYDPPAVIWYTTTDDKIYDLKSIIKAIVTAGGTYNGPAVISNEEKQMWCMTFDRDVTVLGNVNFNEMTAEGPFFVTHTSGLICNVETIILPNTVTRIGDYAFYRCRYLYDIEIPNSVTSIGYEAFYRCSGLTSVTIGNSVTSIGDYAFHECSRLTSVVIPDSVTSIGLNAFEYCTGLNSVTIGNSVTSIGYCAFYGCTSLTSVTCEAITPPTCDGNGAVFNNTNNCPIYVPAQSVDAYKAAENWSEYASRIQAIP